MITSIYELLWADNDLEKDNEDLWLSRLLNLQKLEGTDGNPLGHLGWRMANQAKILSGFPRWQLSNKWYSDGPDPWIVHGLDEATKEIAEGWADWFGEPDARLRRNGSKHNIFHDALRLIDQGHPLYYAAIEGSRLIMRSSLASESVHYWDELLARKHNDIAMIVSDAEESWVSSATAGVRQNVASDRPARLKRTQMLLERLSLRSWQLKGFVNTVASFTKLQLDETLSGFKALPRISDAESLDSAPVDQNAQQQPNEAPQTAKHLLDNLMLCLYTVPWGWPFRQVSRDVLRSLWEQIEPALARSYDRDSVEQAFGILMKHIHEIPKPVIARNSILTMCHEFLRDEACEAMWYYTEAIWQEVHSGIAQRDEALRFWAHIARLSPPASEMMARASQVAELVLNIPRISNEGGDLLSQVAQRVRIERLEELIRKTIPVIRKHMEPAAHNSHDVVELVSCVAYGLMNRKDAAAVSYELISQFVSSFTENPTFLTKHPEIRMIAVGLQKKGFDESDDVAFLNAIVAHITSVIEEACRVDRRKFQLGRKSFPFQRPISPVASKEQISSLVKQVERLAKSMEAAVEEISGVFESVRIFLGGVPSTLRGPIVNTICAFGSEPRLCKSLAPFAWHDKPPIDTSWRAWLALRWIMPKLNQEEVDQIGAVLRNRDIEQLIDNASDVADALGAVASFSSNPELRLWGQQAIRRVLFHWSDSATDTESARPEGIIHCLKCDEHTDEFNDIVHMILDWYEEIASNWRFWQSGRIAYQFGAWLNRLPKNQLLLRAEGVFMRDPRSSVLSAFEAGLKEEIA